MKNERMLYRIWLNKSLFGWGNNNNLLKFLSMKQITQILAIVNLVR